MAGTGSVCISVRAAAAEKTPSTSETPNVKGAQTIVGRRGGLGFLLGDEGSAFHIGRTLLRLIFYANDAGTLKDGEPFLEALLTYWRARSLDELLGMVVSIDFFPVFLLNSTFADLSDFAIFHRRW